MANYSSSYHDAIFGEYYQTPYGGNSDFFPSQSLASHSSYAYNDCASFEYDPAPCYGAYDPDIGQSIVSYSSYICSDPNYVEYGLDPYGGDYSTVKTRFIVSYSVSEFNEPAFEEYDPTPYGGGYDPDATYGKPLPPSEGICYPLSSVDSNDLSLNNFSYGSIKSPYGKDGVDEPVAKPSNGSKTATAKDQEQQSQGSSGDHNVDSKEKPVDSYQGEDSKENYPDGYSSGSGHGNEYEKRVPQIPPGYGLEAMDLCESLFGYWPCWARAKRENDYRNCQGVCSKVSNDNCLWEGSADYLFGNSYPYGERWGNGGSYEHPIFNYERHYQEQHLCRQVDYHEEYSWLN
ncbi:Uncharacterized protein TCM_030054 [Theobroma cacao]|uniref:Uncharacterized protein n=1 Tax=Theobroma cacao TaxID=3641 RepID=A0A061GG24_THECC|nr:Uncharacterized protein TCM_030054 [Theobroma cacao]